MCRRVTCDRCGKPSWAGCGAHVEQVMAGVPRDQRCRCREEAASAGPAQKGSMFGFLSGLFGK